MNKILISLVAALGVAVSVSAQERVASYESLTVGDTAGGITASILRPTAGQISSCSVRLETAAIRYRIDNTAPTATEGMLMNAGDVLTLPTLPDALAFQAIAASPGNSGTLKVSCIGPSVTDPVAPVPGNTGTSLGDIETATETTAGAVKSDGDAFSPASSVMQVGVVRRDTASAGTGVANGDVGLPSMDSVGRIWGRFAIDDGSGNLVSLSTDVVEDEAETAGSSGPPLLGVRRDAAASSAGTTGDNATVNVDALGLLWTRFLDPCSGVAKVAVPVSISSATTTELINGSGASNYAYICSINLVASAADNVALVEDDTDACASPTAGMAGGTTAATGWNLAANGGLTLGNGNGTVAKTAAVNRYVCLITSSTAQLSGTVVYALAP